MGATQASAGMLARLPRRPQPRVSRSGCAPRPLRPFVANVVATADVQVGYQRTGTLEVATSGEQMGALEDLSARLKAHGVALRLLDAPATRAEEPHLGADVAGGLLIESHGFVNAGELTRGLAAAARRHGADFVHGARALRVSPRARGVIVETSREALAGDAVVLAAGSWSSRLEIEGVARPPVRPVRGQLLHLRGATRTCAA